MVRPMCPDCVRGDYDVRVAQTTNVEIDAALLGRLRERRPGKNDRELLESVALSALGRETLRGVQERNALTEQEAIALGIEAMRAARQGVRRHA